jgi:hypothetical protein
MGLDELVHLVERSVVWHAVGELVRQLSVDEWLALAAIAVVLVLVAILQPRRRVSFDRTTAAAAAYQRSVATVHCQCGRVWTVKS